MGTSVELVEGWRVKRIEQIGEIWPGLVAANTHTHPEIQQRDTRGDDTETTQMIFIFYSPSCQKSENDS